MFNGNRKNARIYSYLIPPVVTSLGMILIMIIKQIYPFGQMGFGYNDNNKDGVHVGCNVLLSES